MTDNRRRRSAVRAVMFFAKEPETCGRWWAEQLAPGREVHVEAGGFCWFDLDGVEVGFHPADEERNPVGGSPVVYWSVTDFDTQRRQLLEAGCQPHRGPLDIQPGRRISQLVDPFGNIFGIDGLRQQVPPTPRLRCEQGHVDHAFQQRHTARGQCRLLPGREAPSGHVRGCGTADAPSSGPRLQRFEARGTREIACCHERRLTCRRRPFPETGHPRYRVPGS